MKLKINEKTPLARYSVFAEDLAKDAYLRCKAWSFFVGRDFYALTIDEFCALVEDGTWQARAVTRGGEMTLLGFVFSDVLRTFVEELTRAVKAYTPPPTTLESGVEVKCTMIEAMMFFVREFFGLPSFKAASEITIGDYLLAKKAEYIRVMNERQAVARARRKATK